MDTEVLVRRARHGQRKAFGELYERLAPTVYSYFYYQLGGDSNLAETLTENVFVEVLDKLRQYRVDDRGFVVWVLWIARTCLHGHLDSRSEDHLTLTNNSADSRERRVRLKLNRPLTQTEVLHLMAHLTNDEQQVISLRFLHGFSLVDVAHVLSQTEDAIKRLQAHGLKNLMHALGASHRVTAVA